MKNHKKKKKTERKIRMMKKSIDYTLGYDRKVDQDFSEVNKKEVSLFIDLIWSFYYVRRLPVDYKASWVQGFLKERSNKKRERQSLYSLIHGKKDKIFSRGFY